MDEKSLQVLEFDKVRARLATHASFSAGEALALQLTPTTDAVEARRWQSETREAVILLDKRTDVSIGGARDVRRQAENAQRGFVLQPADLLDVQATIAAARELKRKLERARESYPGLYRTGALIEECPGIVSVIGRALDERGEVLDSASEQLGKIRRDLRVAHGRIQDKLRSLIGSSDNQYLQEPLITTRGGRYVVPLRADYKGRIKGVVHDQSSSGATLWIEPLNTVDLNNEYRSLQLAEEEEIRRILSELSAMVGEQADAIVRIVDRMAELDLIFARARYASATDGVMPQFIPWRDRVTVRSASQDGQSDEHPATPHPGSTVWIRGARHPLLDADSVVPTDLLIDEDTFLVLITGPNTGGKTVSLKTAGLMVLMAQAGLHLPAVEARLTVFGDVFADIGDEQSIEQNLSTFSGHMQNIVRIMSHANERSLVLLDELGSGTDPAEGAALAQAIVSWLRDMGVTTFVATHFPELKLYASQTPGATNASLLFDVDTLMPTYEMSIGMPGRSNAFAIARRLGLEPTVLNEALTLVGAGSSKAESLLDSIYEMRERILSQEAGARLSLRQAEEERDRLRARLETIESERAQILDDAHRQAAGELDTLRDEIDGLRKTLRDAESKTQLKKLRKHTEDLEESVSAALKPAAELPPDPAKKRRKQTDDLHVGDTVFITTIGATGKILALDKRTAEVAVGRLHMRVELDELEFREREEEEPAPAPAVRAPARSPGMELDLRGKRVDEGIQELESHLDAAFLANLPWVRIIHGKGTGRLREAVRKELQDNAHVAAWEEGRDGEGGAGVTVAKLDID